MFHGNGNAVHMRGDAWLVFYVTFANLNLQTRSDYVNCWAAGIILFSSNMLFFPACWTTM